MRHRAEGKRAIALAGIRGAPQWAASLPGYQARLGEPWFFAETVRLGNIQVLHKPAGIGEILAALGRALP